MLTIYSDDHRLHHGRHELIGGQFTPASKTQPRRHGPRPREGRRPRRSPRTARLRPGTDPPGAQRGFRAFPAERLAGLAGHRPQPRHAADRLADPAPAADGAGQHRRSPRLLLLRRRRADHRRDLAGDHQFGQRRPQRPVRTRQRRALGIFALSPAGPPRRGRLHGRLLLLQQCRHRRPGLPRPGRRAGGDPRRRLPPWQRHPGHLLRPRRCAVHLDPRRSALRIPLFPRLRRREGQRRRHRLQLQLPTGGRQRLGDLEPGAAGGDPADPGLCGGRPDRFLGWIPSRRTRFPSSAWTAPTTCAWAKPSASSAWPRCS